MSWAIDILSVEAEEGRKCHLCGESKEHHLRREGDEKGRTWCETCLRETYDDSEYWNAMQADADREEEFDD